MFTENSIAQLLTDETKKQFESELLSEFGNEEIEDETSFTSIYDSEKKNTNKISIRTTCTKSR